jgi:hypothetical protein
MKLGPFLAILIVTLSQAAYAKPNNCSGDACGALSIIPEQPGVGQGNWGETVINSSNRPVSGSVTWFYAGCLRSSTPLKLGPNGRYHTGNNGYCNVTANFTR